MVMSAGRQVGTVDICEEPDGLGWERIAYAEEWSTFIAIQLRSSKYLLDQVSMYLVVEAELCLYAWAEERWF